MAKKLQQLFVVTGPESTGKSTLARLLANRLSAPLVPEVARDYLAGRRNYDVADFKEIARLQQRTEDEALASGAPIVVADTDFQVLELWWRERFAAADPAYSVTIPKRKQVRSAYLLCYPDIAWQPDPLRENPLDRDRLFRLHIDLLEAARAEYRVIWGAGAFRNRLAQAYIESKLTQFGAKKITL